MKVYLCFLASVAMLFSCKTPSDSSDSDTAATYEVRGKTGIYKKTNIYDYVGLITEDSKWGGPGYGDLLVLSRDRSGVRDETGVRKTTRKDESLFVPFSTSNSIARPLEVGVCAFHINLDLGGESRKTGIVAYAKMERAIPGKHNFQTGENDPTIYTSQLVGGIVVDCAKLEYQHNLRGSIKAADIPLQAGKTLGEYFPRLRE